MKEYGSKSEIKSEYTLADFGLRALSKWESWKRKWRMRYDKLTKGYSEYDLWNLDHTCGKFILPRLRAFKERSCGYPADMSNEEWNEILDKMILGMEVAADGAWEHIGSEKMKQAYEGLELFGEYYFTLQW